MIDELIVGGADLEVKAYDGATHLLRGADFWPDIASWITRINI